MVAPVACTRPAHWVFSIRPPERIPPCRFLTWNQISGGARRDEPRSRVGPHPARAEVLASKIRCDRGAHHNGMAEEHTPMTFPIIPRRTPWAGILVGLAVLPVVARAADQDGKDKAKPAPAATVKVSYDKQIRPIFQAHCQGCHQPAKAGGGYVMTAFDRLLKGGESRRAGHRAGQARREPPDRADHPARTARPRCRRTSRRWPSRRSTLITPVDRPGGRRRHAADRPGQRYDMDHPPEYTRPPVIPALAFSPDGSLLAVGRVPRGRCSGRPTDPNWSAGWSACPSGSSRSRSRPTARGWPSPAAVPRRMGEVQVWDVAKRKLVALRSGHLRHGLRRELVARRHEDRLRLRRQHGAGHRREDRRAGAVHGRAHDWVLDTVFSVDGSHLISVGRDMAAKLTEVATQRFVDNITSITPGALKGGLAAVARHPKRDEIVIGGSDGMPKLYRVFRQTARVIGDDSNLIREFPGACRAGSTAWPSAPTASGSPPAAALTARGRGRRLRLRVRHRVARQHQGDPGEGGHDAARPRKKRARQAYHKAGVKQIATVKMPQGGIYAVSSGPTASSWPRRAATGSSG